MSLASKTSYNFYVEGGSGADKADPSLLAEAKQYAAIDRDKGNNTLLGDENLGAMMVNLQHLSNDVDEVRRFIAAQDELLEVLRGSIPTGLQYSSGWYIPITSTDWQGIGQATKDKAIDGYHQVNLGHHSENGIWAFCEKVIPIGFRADSAIVYGRNAGATSQKFTCTETAINASTGNSLGSLTDHASTQTFSSQITGDGLKSITITNKMGNDKNDVIYGGKINLTQV